MILSSPLCRPRLLSSNLYESTYPLSSICPNYQTVLFETECKNTCKSWEGEEITWNGMGWSFIIARVQSRVLQRGDVVVLDNSSSHKGQSFILMSLRFKHNTIIWFSHTDAHTYNYTPTSQHATLSCVICSVGIQVQINHILVRCVCRNWHMVYFEASVSTTILLYKIY